MRTKIKTRKSKKEQLAEWNKTRLENQSWRGKKRRFGGFVPNLPRLGEWMGSTRHTCGQWPFVAGSAAPGFGAQLGTHYYTREPIGFDPLTWFDMGFIWNPSAFLLANPATGKSSTMRKMMTGVIASGTNVIVAGDRKNEHTRLIEFMDGQIIHLGPGRGKLNILDPGGVIEAVRRIEAECEDPEVARVHISELIGDMHSRRLAMVTGLISIFRQSKVTGHERSILDAALRWLHNNHEGTPILTDLLDAIRAMPADVRRVANDWNDDEEYRKIVRPLENDLTGLCSGGGLGEIFNGQTTQEVRRDRSVCFDIHGIDENDKDNLSAAYIAIWSASFAMINVAHAYADTGLEAARRYFVVIDEVWQPLAASPGMVDRFNSITRLNRDKGVGTVYASHTMSDMEAIESEADRNKAKGIIARCGAILLGGLARDELVERVKPVAKLRDEEIELLVSWNVPPSLAERGGDMPGRGKFLIKIGEAPGLPVDVKLTPKEVELGLHDTNKRIRRVERAKEPRS